MTAKAQFDKYYQAFSDELHQAVGSYLFWKVIQHRAGTDPNLLKGLNETPLSWLMIRHSLQVTTFITLGRIFDIDDDAFSADDLLKTCIEEIEIFSIDNLKSRKMEGRQEEPDWLDGYLKEAHVPVDADFQMLRGELSKRRKLFENVYQPIRHKLIAHKDKEFIGKADELWQETNIDELENLLNFLHNLRETLFEQYQNGRKPLLQDKEIDRDFYEDDYGRLLELVKVD